ncbi:uncharacterized protein PITG_08266 [Phytophthora infestans T30-4]|uniref:Enoyl reductase (ER) domain-containing protein n=1 Tax=Phytophthora infestans (strain T30-4) TaxID=403677 RepID=D0NA75_PHYIT|nr:uncharacterized protein PITG_08266 [Phytophthora infestans T30-4]EEY54733.1 conserved hypothetical protein [Phytophthora infestans T30-4]|eukprot:XP_002903678.1 conserved hypothetical protein [Phytophthora infestans T30-4]
MLKRLVKLYIVTGGRILPTVTLPSKTSLAHVALAYAGHDASAPSHNTTPARAINASARHANATAAPVRSGHLSLTQVALQEVERHRHAIATVVHRTNQPARNSKRQFPQCNTAASAALACPVSDHALSHHSGFDKPRSRRIFQAYAGHDASAPSHNTTPARAINASARHANATAAPVRSGHLSLTQVALQEVERHRHAIATVVHRTNQPARNSKRQFPQCNTAASAALACPVSDHALSHHSGFDKPRSRRIFQAYAGHDASAPSHNTTPARAINASARHANATAAPVRSGHLSLTQVALQEVERHRHAIATVVHRTNQPARNSKRQFPQCNTAASAALACPVSDHALSHHSGFDKPRSRRIFQAYAGHDASAPSHNTTPARAINASARHANATATPVRSGHLSLTQVALQEVERHRHAIATVVHRTNQPARNSKRQFPQCNTAASAALACPVSDHALSHHSGFDKPLSRRIFQAYAGHDASAPSHNTTPARAINASARHANATAAPVRSGHLSLTQVALQEVERRRHAIATVVHRTNQPARNSKRQFPQCNTAASAALACPVSDHALSHHSGFDKPRSRRIFQAYAGHDASAPFHNTTPARAINASARHANATAAPVRSGHLSLSRKSALIAPYEAKFKHAFPFGMLKRLVKLYIVTGGRILPTVTITKLKFLDVGPKLQNNPRLIRAGDEIILDGKRIRAVGHDAVSVVECDATNLHQDFVWTDLRSWFRHDTKSTMRRGWRTSYFGGASGVTAWNALFGVLPLKAGQTVLFQGTGCVSIIGLQIAKAAGATTIITSSSDEKLKFVQEKFVVNQITSGRGVDFVLENGGSGTITQSIEAIAVGGVISVIGFLSPEKQEDMPDLTVLLLGKGCIVRGISLGSQQQLRALKTFGFNREEVFAAFDYLQTGRHIGKIGIEIKLAYGLKPEKRSSQTSRVFFWLVNEEEEDKENWKKHTSID